MKGFDIAEVKKSARIKQLENNRSYSQIHKSPLRHGECIASVLSQWGRSFETRDAKECWTNIGQGILAVSVGQEHALILNNRNECLGMGSNSYGQLTGEGETMSKPTQLTVFKDAKIIGLACGAYHSFVLNSKNELYAFGMNMKGQLGIGSFDNKSKPILVSTLLPGGAKNPKANFLAEATDCKRRLRKRKEDHELANITNLLSGWEEEEEKINMYLEFDEHVTKIVCGPLHSAALTNKFRLFTCGFGEKYALGTGKSKTINEFTEVRVKSNGRIDRIDAGITSLGYISGGRAFVVGTIGMKVFDTFTALIVPDDVVQMKIADSCVIVLTRRGEILQLGDFKTDSHLVDPHPRKIDKLPIIRQIYKGANCFFALSQSKIVYGWGQNNCNQVTGVADSPIIMNPKPLKIPFSVSQGFNIVGGNNTTFVLSHKLLESYSIEKEGCIYEDDQPKHLQHQKSCAKNIQRSNGKNLQRSCNKSVFNHSDQKISELGIQPRMFNCNVEIDFKELVFESQISQGGYGIIYKGLWRQTTVAIKIFKIQSQNAVKDFFSECGAMQALRHPNVVMFLGACTKSPNYAIVLQYCNNGSLWSTIQNLDQGLSWQDRRRFALDTARGVNYLHTCTPAIIHRDLKSLNLLLDESYRVKLADFGWTKGLDNYMTGKIGTYQWMAPEVIASQKYSQKADVFSYGIILWEIASREPPFKQLSGLQVSLEVLNNDLRPSIPKKTPEPFAKLMKKCWDRQPSKRPSFKEIIKELTSMKLF